MIETQVETFNENRPLLFGIAWRMLGRAADAEDILQEAFIRWQRTDESDIRSPRAFLVTTVTRLCLNHLDLAYVKREQPYDAETFLEDQSANEMNPAGDADLSDALDAAFSVVLRCLSPVERAVFLLRDVFDRDYSEVARIVEKGEDNCRQILRRARERIAGQKPRFEVTLEQQEIVLREFLSATTSGDVERLADLLAGEISLLRDASNLGAEPPPLICGAAAVSAFLTGKAEPLSSRMTVRMMSFKEMPVLLTYYEEKLQSMLALVLRAGKVQTLYLITCPVRLRSLAAQCPSPTAE